MHGKKIKNLWIGSFTKKTVILILPLVFAGLFFGHSAYATPVAPVSLINHTLKQCIDQVILADECYICTPEEGWQILPAGQCPSEYKFLSLQSFLDQPLNCVEYPKNEWAACSWGKFPTMTPEFQTSTDEPGLTITLQQSGIYPNTPSATLTATLPESSSSELNVYSILLIGCIIVILIIGIGLLIRKRMNNKGK
jgi:hypothetical protein